MHSPPQKKVGGNVCVSYGVKGPPFGGGGCPKGSSPKPETTFLGKKLSLEGRGENRQRWRKQPRIQRLGGGVQSSTCLQVETPPPSLLLSGLPFTPSMPRLLSLPPILL